MLKKRFRFHTSSPRVSQILCHLCNYNQLLFLGVKGPSKISADAASVKTAQSICNVSACSGGWQTLICTADNGASLGILILQLIMWLAHGCLLSWQGCCELRISPAWPTLRLPLRKARHTQPFTLLPRGVMGNIVKNANFLVKMRVLSGSTSV